MIRTEQSDKKSMKRIPDPCSEEYVCLTVSDTGTGMSRQVIKHLFEPFFTTKNIGKLGTGLGLSIVYGIVQQHKGWIDVQSKPGKGTEFRIYFPLLASCGPEVKPGQEDHQVMAGNRCFRIMLVEDDPDLRRSTQYVFQSAGYEVYAVESAEQAVGLLRMKNIDLLVSDVDLPGQSGIELAERVLSEKKDLRVLITSGHDEACIDMQAIARNGFMFVKKPFKAVDIINIVDRILLGKKKYH